MDDTLGLIGLAEAAEELGVKHSTLRAQIHRKRLLAVKVGRDWLVSTAEIERYRRDVQGGRAGESQRRRRPAG